MRGMGLSTRAWSLMKRSHSLCKGSADSALTSKDVSSSGLLQGRQATGRWP
jgi:hypothetical protein